MEPLGAECAGLPVDDSAHEMDEGGLCRAANPEDPGEVEEVWASQCRACGLWAV